MKPKDMKKEWKVVPFEEIGENITERVNPSEAKTEVYVGLEHLDPDTIHLKQWGHPADVEGDKFRFQKGDVIFGRRRAYQRKLAVAEFDGICSAHALVVRAKPKTMLPEFLPFFLQSDVFMERAISISVGSLSPTINWKTLKAQEFSLPSISEQKRIAEILWALDQTAENWGKTKNDVRELISVMREKQFSETDEKDISLGEITKLITKGESPGWQGFKYGKEGVLFVTSENVLEGEYSPEPKKYIPFEFHEKLKRSQLRKGDVLVNLVGASIGRACVYNANEVANVNQAVAVVRCDLERIFPEFLLSYFMAPTNLRKLMGGSVNTARANISLSQLRDSRIVLPSLLKQKILVQKISALQKFEIEVGKHCQKIVSLRKNILKKEIESV